MDIVAICSAVVEMFFSVNFDVEMEDDEDELALLELARVNDTEATLHGLAEDVVPRMSGGQFKSHFRMLPETFEAIVALLGNHLVREYPGREMVAPYKQMLIAIWRLATPDSYRSISLTFGLSKTTTIRIVKRVCAALCELITVIIQWPSPDVARGIAEAYERSSTFPGVIGAVDGTHIEIPAPKENPTSYINRKGYHSIQMQAVCDNKCRFLHCFVGNPGSVHDARVFRRSSLANYLGVEEKFPNNTHVIADAAYKLHPNVLTPYIENGHLTLRQRNYNKRLSTARMSIERAFGLLKGRWRSLLHILAVDKIQNIPLHVVACCILHNICIGRNDLIEDFFVCPQTEVCVPDDNREDRRQEGVHKRERICATLPLRDA